MRMLNRTVALRSQVAAVLLGIGLAFALTFVPSSARADDEETEQARKHYQKGKQQFDLGKWDAAIAEFEAAYTLHADPNFLFNLAQAYRRKGDLQHALDLYRNYLIANPESPKRSDIEKRIKMLEKEMKRRPPATPVARPSEAPPAPPVVVAPALGPEPSPPKPAPEAAPPQAALAAALPATAHPALATAPAVPPALAPQPGYHPSPPARPATRRGLLFLPYVGFSSLVGDGSDRYSTGLRLGAMLGGHIGPLFSLNGELGIDIMNPDTKGYSDHSVTEVFLDFTLSPFFHFGVPYVEFVLGPKIGLFAWLGSTTYSNTSADFSGYGLVYGFTAGAFFPIGRMAIGGILSYTGRKFLEDSCSISGGGHCYDYYSTVDTQLISFSVALML